jgi:multidrug efflux pump subunit AcrB
MSSASGPIPISAVTKARETAGPTLISHMGQFPATTVSFNLAPGASLGAAVKAIEKVQQGMPEPPAMIGAFQGTVAAFVGSLANEGILVLSALLTVYIVLGVLYESYIHPITILSTLPSASVGALLALLVCGSELTVVAIIGIVLLIGIVQKNAIMMIDFALEAQRKEHKDAFAAIREACLLRFRPILMTTMAALLGAVPLAFGHGVGSELRRPLGITIIGGLIFSQMLTLYTTPVIYLYFDGWPSGWPGGAGARARSGCVRRGYVRRAGPAAVNFSAPFIKRPIATTLLTTGVVLMGMAAFRVLPVSPLPQVDFPTINVSAQLPGASPEIMASSVATPLEREFGRISSVTEMSSQSTLGQVSITLQFDLSRNIDAATRDVESAINAARSYLPANLPSNPTYRKVNPADAPIMIVALTSDKLPPSALYDAASTILEQRLSQIGGVGQVVVGGSSAPAVRINVNPTQLSGYGLSLETVRSAIAAETANEAKGGFSSPDGRWTISANDQLMKAADYAPLIVSYSNGQPVMLSKVATIEDSVQTVRSLGIANGRRAALLVIFRQPGANIITTVDSIKKALPQLRASIDPSIIMSIGLDQTQTIRASVADIERTLLISIGLVVLVVFVFLREYRATLIPLIAVPTSIIGTLAAMYLFGYSIDNLSLMALTISTGFVVDDAIVVLENITRHREMGKDADKRPWTARRRSARPCCR